MLQEFLHYIKQYQHYKWHYQHYIHQRCQCCMKQQNLYCIQKQNLQYMLQDFQHYNLDLIALLDCCIQLLMEDYMMQLHQHYNLRQHQNKLRHYFLYNQKY